MPPALSTSVRAAGALLLLTACTWVVEIAALLAVWNGKVLAPYAFFPNQAWDFLAKIRWACSGLLDFAPALPDRFAGLAIADKLDALAPLFASTLATALVVGAAGGLLLAFVSRRPGTLRRDVILWAIVAACVHLAVAIPPMNLQDGIGRVVFRSRSLVVDGTAVALAVCVASTMLAAALAPVVARSRALAAAGLAAMAGAAAWGMAVSPVHPLSDAAGTRAADPARPRHNVLLISLDSLRADHVGAYGYSRDTSPNFDRFARDGVLFRNAVSTSSWTLPTHLTMFTGRSQVSHGVVVDTVVLPRSVPTLGEIFQEAGYATAGFVSGPYVGGHYGYARGMDEYIDLSAAWGKGAEARGAILSPDINAKALAWLDEPRDRPFFLFLHYFDIHYDFVPPPPYDTMFDPDYTGTMDGRFFIERDDVHPRMDPRDLEHIKALYDGEIRFTDEHVGRVLDRLRDKGLLDSTVVMIVSDHGDEFFEHGNKGHHRTVYDEVLRIPFALRLPGGAHAGRAVEEQVSLIDVFPTLLDAAGLPVPADAEGDSLARWLEGQAPSRAAIYSDFYDKRGFNLQVARRTPSTKTIQHFNRITHPRRGPLEHYELDVDPAEKDNRADDRPDRVQASLEEMASWLGAQWSASRASRAAAGGDESIEIDEETMQRLESLGYVGD